MYVAHIQALLLKLKKKKYILFFDNQNKKEGSCGVALMVILENNRTHTRLELRKNTKVRQCAVANLQPRRAVVLNSKKYKGDGFLKFCDFDINN